MAAVPRLVPLPTTVTHAVAFWVLGGGGGPVALVWQLATGGYTGMRFADGRRVWAPTRLDAVTRLAALPVRRGVGWRYVAGWRYARFRRVGGHAYNAACVAAVQYGCVAGDARFDAFVAFYRRAVQLLPR